MKNKPCFFKIVIGDYLTHRVRIPSPFMKHLLKDMSHRTTMNATIKGGAGSWPVKLRKTSTDTYLAGGWQKVMEDNLLGDGEVLLFRYDGNMCFNLQIFEKTGCERIYSPATSSVEEKNQGEHEKQLDDDDGNSAAAVKQALSFSSQNRHLAATSIEEKNQKEHKRVKDIKIKAAARKQALAFSSQNPHFKICFKSYHVQKVYTLRIPSGFCRMHFRGSGRKKLCLENSNGEAWEVNALWIQRAYWLCGGWRDFANANKLKPGDHGIFELLDKKVMRMHKE